MSALTAIHRDDASVYHLPGRDWLLLLGPENSASRNLTIGVAIFPAGSAPAPHVHPAQEEIVYVVSGRGRLVTPEETAALVPGTAVFIPVGLEHGTVNVADEPLELVSVFSPPVVPGSYEPSTGR